LNVFPIVIPPLRKRPEDIAPLALYFLDQACGEYGKKIKLFTDEALERLQGYSWPGNVRELQNVVHRAVLLASGNKIPSDLLNIGGRPSPVKILPSSSAPLMLDQGQSTESIKTIDDLEKDAIIRALDKLQGNVSHVAKALGISRTTLYNKAKRYDIDLAET
jgi:DNA-binding NtrC family response regulator